MYALSNSFDVTLGCNCVSLQMKLHRVSWITSQTLAFDLLSCFFSLNWLWPSQLIWRYVSTIKPSYCLVYSSYILEYVKDLSNASVHGKQFEVKMFVGMKFTCFVWVFYQYLCHRHTIFIRIWSAQGAAMLVRSFPIKDKNTFEHGVLHTCVIHFGTSRAKTA